MNPLDLSASELLIWGIVCHLVADWPLQSDWMSRNKTRIFRHPAGVVHAGIHGLLFASIFGWVAIPLAYSHLLIDTRKPVEWWSKLMRQTQPTGIRVSAGDRRNRERVAVLDVGMYVRMQMDQVFHIICVAVAALAVAS